MTTWEWNLADGFKEDVDGVVTFSDRDENDIRDVVPRSNDGILGSGGAGAKELNVQEQHVSNYFINVRDGGNVDFRSQDTHFHQTDHTETNDSPQEEQQEEAQETTLPRGIFDGVFDVIHTVKWLLRTLLPPRLLTYFLLLCAIFIACLNAFALLFPGGATILQTFNSPALNRLIFTPAPATTYTSDTNIPTLSFRHPVPTQESDIMPTAVEVSWRGVKALDSQLSGTLDQDFEDARSKAEKFKALNEGFVEGIESESVDHYRRLANLIADIDRTLNSEETGWFWGGGGKAKRHVRSLTKVVKEAKEGRGKEREMIARTLKGVKGDGGPVPAGICHIERALENVRDGGEGLQDQKAAMRVMCSSERRSGVRWRDVEEAISRVSFLFLLPHLHRHPRPHQQQ